MICVTIRIGDNMKLRKTLFFEIPSKDFIMPVYTEEDVNTLKSFLNEDEVLFSIGYKSMEDENGLYYIGQVKEFTELFYLHDFPLVYRKRVLDILEGLNENPKYIFLEEELGMIRKIVYFKSTKLGPKCFMMDYSESNLEKLIRQDIHDYYIKEVPAFIISNFSNRETYDDQEIFYQIKNPNY